MTDNPQTTPNWETTELIKDGIRARELLLAERLGATLTPEQRELVQAYREGLDAKN